MDLFEYLLNQPAHILWLIGGVGCLVIAMLAFDPLLSALGISALITAIASLTIQNVGAQLLIWGILSIALAVVFRGFVPRESKDLQPATDAIVSKSIPSGGMGEVSYEGSYWSARCQISDVTIASGQVVHVVGRQNNTLIVLPTVFPDDGENLQDRSV